MRQPLTRKQRRLRRVLRGLSLQADQAHGEKLDRLCNEIEEARLGVRLAESIGGSYA